MLLLLQDLQCNPRISIKVQVQSSLVSNFFPSFSISLLFPSCLCDSLRNLLVVMEFPRPRDLQQYKPAPLASLSLPLCLSLCAPCVPGHYKVAQMISPSRTLYGLAEYCAAARHQHPDLNIFPPPSQYLIVSFDSLSEIEAESQLLALFPIPVRFQPTLLPCCLLRPFLLVGSSFIVSFIISITFSS
ncbi:hypothetical protein VTN77DRAFT_8241 [Rasamsonia byssochlamydoides]|uniref:uncharacterized protein n=1 Tax=Rasamsonia byssochlamydoides TaxID=89139 RepID=UPI0037448E23